MTEDSDINFSRLALELAAGGRGLVSPNPLVGCLIVSADGEIAGEGVYTFAGVRHAECLAIEQAGDRVRGGTAYVSLEPHDHQGKTPPCTEILINAGIKRVVCPIEDPNPLVSGKGFERLRNAGIEVVTGLLAADASRLNEKFICWHKKKRPFVHLKLAVSLDGRIALKNSVSTALSSDEALKRVHDLRHEYDAILVGGNTAFVDRPSLTDRSEKPRRLPLVRIVLDNRLQISADSPLVTTAHKVPTVVFTNSKNDKKIKYLRNLEVDVCEIDDGARNLDAVLNALAAMQIQSVLVEGGSEVAGAFCDAGLVDKISLIVAPIIIGGPNAPVAIGGKGSGSLEESLKLRDITVARLGPDIEITGYTEELE